MKPQFTTQKIDILVDNGRQNQWLAVECKSTKANGIGFNHNFHLCKGVHQVIVIDTFINQTGREGIMAVECTGQMDKNQPKTRPQKRAYLLPWEYVMYRYKSYVAGEGKERISEEQLQEHGSKLTRMTGGYKL
jgi:hypothetical protein